MPTQAVDTGAYLGRKLKKGWPDVSILVSSRVSIFHRTLRQLMFSSFKDLDGKIVLCWAKVSL